MKKIKINNSEDLNDILSDMLDDFLRNITSYPQYTTKADGDRLFEYEEGIEWYYTDTGMLLIERWMKRMRKIFDKYFDGEDFNPTSTYYKEF